MRLPKIRALLWTSAVLVPGLVVAGVTLPHTFSNGAVADATEVNANFGALKAALDQRDGSSPARAAASCRDLDALGFPTGSYWSTQRPRRPTVPSRCTARTTSTAAAGCSSRRAFRS